MHAAVVAGGAVPALSGVGIGRSAPPGTGRRAQLDGLNEETVVSVDGAVTPNAQAPGGFELTDPHITKLSSRATAPPVELWRPSLNTSLPTLLDHAPVLWRHRSQQAVWRLAAASLRGFRRVLDNQGFTEIQTPKLVGTSTESEPILLSSATSVIQRI